MSTNTVTLTPYEGRLKTVSDAIQANSKLTGKVAGDIAVQILHALDTIPERIR